MYIVANWKGYVESSIKAQSLFTAAKKLSTKKGVHIFLTPSFLHISALTKGNRSKVQIGAQDISAASVSAATGEITGTLLAHAGVSFVIVGHSERRALRDDSETVVQKVHAALAAGCTPILCIGERERDEEGVYLQQIRTEVHAVFSTLSEKEKKVVMIAYEPIWAIGKSSSQAITGNDLNEMVRYIRKVLGEYLAVSAVQKVPVLYGGSVDATNAKELVQSAPIDGFLVGRASTDVKTFSALVTSLTR